MANVASVLKDEFVRVARKEVRRETALLRRVIGIPLGDRRIERRVLELERQARKTAKGSAADTTAAANDEINRKAPASAPRAWHRSGGASACRRMNAVFSSARRPSRSTTGRTARPGRGRAIFGDLRASEPGSPRSRRNRRVTQGRLNSPSFRPVPCLAASL